MSDTLIIKLVRHGESESNTKQTDPLDVGDHRIRLTPRGRRQAHSAGRRIGKRFIDEALVYCSPYTRTRETLTGILEGASVEGDMSVRIYEDPRLREVDLGYQELDAQIPMRLTHGWFYYRYDGGESPADCYDRISTFLESMMRQVERKGTRRVLIVSHGLMLRAFVMRFMHLTVEQFESLENPNNCDVITLSPKSRLRNPQFTSGRWGVTGLRFRKKPRRA
ncbi:MAG: histidine phosphatase family protein [Burkholderiales bacterium]|nr:histidine phosphatase family protein [Burkholderiales bacterium]